MATPNDVTFHLSRSRRSVPRARALLLSTLATWQVASEDQESAEVVLSELVTNALCADAPPDQLVGVRIARNHADGLLRIEVSDGGLGLPEVRTPGDDETGGRGLVLVTALAHEWGVDVWTAGNGKTVWAQLKSPGIAAQPEAVEVAAVRVLVGHRVRVWGAWLTVRSTHTEPCATLGTAVVLGLDDGPPLRVQATDPLSVQR